jgi:hypothetical protein
MHVHIQTFPQNQTPLVLTLLISSSLGHPWGLTPTNSILNFEDCSAPITNIPLVDVKNDQVLNLGTSIWCFKKIENEIGSGHFEDVVFHFLKLPTNCAL